MKPPVARRIVEALHASGVNFITSLPEGNLAPLVRELASRATEIPHVPLAREEEGVGVCTGAYLGGALPAMVTMNAGFLASANALVTVQLAYGIATVYVIGYSGGIFETEWLHTPLGLHTEQVMAALHIPYQRVTTPDGIPESIGAAARWTVAARHPAAVLLDGEALR